MSRRRMRNRAMIGGLVALALVFLVLLLVEGNDESAAETAIEVAGTSGCVELDRAVVGQLRRTLPGGWDVEAAVGIDVEGRHRGDGAPVSVLAAWVIDADGEPVTEGPPLWVYEGGMTREHETAPKSLYFLNGEASEVLEAGYAAMDEETLSRRIRTRDARTLSTPYAEDSDFARRAVECLDSVRVRARR